MALQDKKREQAVAVKYDNKQMAAPTVIAKGEGFVALTEGNNVVTLSLTLTLPTSGLDNASGDITPVNVIGFVKGTDSKVTAVKTLSLTYTDGTFKYTVS